MRINRLGCWDFASQTPAKSQQNQAMSQQMESKLGRGGEFPVGPTNEARVCPPRLAVQIALVTTRRPLTPVLRHKLPQVVENWVGCWADAHFVFLGADRRGASYARPGPT